MHVSIFSFFLGFVHAFPCALETHTTLEVGTHYSFYEHDVKGIIYGNINLIMTLERIIKLQVRKLVALFEQEAKYWEHHREIEQHKFQQTQRLQPGLRSAYPNANKVCCK